MIANTDERAERQLYAACRLISSWPSVDVQRNTARSATTLAKNSGQAMDITIT
jgi:hypothetical protein